MDASVGYRRCRGSKVRKEESDWLGGGVIDQPLSVLKGNGDGVDGHALVLHRLPPPFDEAVQQDGQQDEDGHAQEGSDRYDSCGRKHQVGR